MSWLGAAMPVPGMPIDKASDDAVGIAPDR